MAKLTKSTAAAQRAAKINSNSLVEVKAEDVASASGSAFALALGMAFPKATIIVAGATIIVLGALGGRKVYEYTKDNQWSLTRK